MLLKRLRILSGRIIRARRLGLSFKGTSSFKLPGTAMLFSDRVPLHFPDDPLLALDIIDVWLDDDYGLEGIATPVKSIIDIGGNVGVFSLWAHRNFPKAVIHTYEPNAEVLPFLHKNLDPIDQVKVWPEGVSGAAGRASLQPQGSSRLCRTTSDPSGNVILTPLSEAIARIGGSVDLLKIDCEGAEWAIFEEVQAFEGIRSIRMEYHLTDERTLDDLKDALDSVGFEMTKLKANDGFGIAFCERKLKQNYSN